MASAVAIAPAASAAAPDATTPAVDARLMAAVIRVADAPRAAAFYERALGMKTLMSRDLGTIHETMLGFAGAPGQPGIMLVNRLAASPEPLRGAGASRLIVAVASLDAVVARMDAAGLAHGAIRAVAPGIRVLDIADPEHNELELVEKTPAK